MSDQLLSMFFDDEFVPHAYLGALYSGSIPNGSTKQPQDTYLSSKDIKLLRQRSNVLLNHLDYYTKELMTDLESKIQKLYNSNSIISYSYDHSSSNSEDKLKPTTRLEYYVNSLSISLSSLRASIISISDQLEQSGDAKGSTSTKLIKLNQSKDNLHQVLNTLDVIKSILEINNTNSTPTIPKHSVSSAPTNSKSSRATAESITMSLKSFQESLDILQATIVEQFQKSPKASADLLAKVKELIQLSPVFKNLDGFSAAYSGFVKGIEGVVQSQNESKE